MHPAHVPLHREPQATGIGGPGHHRPVGRFLRDHDRAGAAPVHDGVELADEVDCFQVVVAAVPVGHVVALATAEVEVEHRGDRVDAQAVEVELLQPVERARDQERAHFVPLVVEHQRAPVLVLRLARIGVFVQCAAVEVGETVCIAREMPRHPVEQHADAGAVAGVDEVAQVVGRAMARGRREVAGGLVAPGVVERMLGDRHQLDVGEAAIAHPGHELVGELAVVQERIVGAAAPGAEVQLVDADRCVLPVEARPRRHPALVAELVRSGRGHDRGGGRPALARPRHRVALQVQRAGDAIANLVLVDLERADARQEQLPHPARAA